MLFFKLFSQRTFISFQYVLSWLRFNFYTCSKFWVAVHKDPHRDDQIVPTAAKERWPVNRDLISRILPTIISEELSYLAA